ncbi:aminoglycoside phosphotransferase family protein [Microlunatus sp. GCM10028923]|uniref:aminoglycoside phosphotransferase family protein n=1 Tax=Microlunatus sp. GCM10028923 TaxID=3273400 RepID=UPI0036146257
MEIISRDPLAGGFSDAAKFRLRVAINQSGRRVERTVLLKHTSQLEIDAMQAAAKAADADAVPEIVEVGKDDSGPYLMSAFYEAAPATDETSLPPNVIETLARVHRHYLTEPPPESIPVVDAAWWRSKCDVSMERLAKLDRPVPNDLIPQVAALQQDRRITDPLDRLPRTLLHGDVHRNNVLDDDCRIGHLIDWGGALVGTPALDIANLGGPDSSGYKTYIDTWHRLTGQRLDLDRDWASSYLLATVWINIKYLAFAAKVYGDAKAQEMMQSALQALNQLDSDHSV